MKQQIARTIVRSRMLWMLLLLLAVMSAFTVGKTTVNYDLTAYLAEDTDTKRGLRLMDGEFEPVSSMSVVLVDASASDVAARTSAIAGLPGVTSALHDPDTDVRQRDGHSYSLISVIMPEQQEEAVLDTVEEMLADTPHLISGSASDNRTLRESIVREMPLVMVVSCVIVFAILLLMTRSFLEPVLFFLIIAVSILINMGTNWIFPSISFITFAVTAILQLALAMDYSIMLLNAFDRHRQSGSPAPEAMEQALASSFMPIVSSALTTVAGMLALVFMRFTIGFDIGIVLAKGILISMLTVFLFMPGVLVLSAPLLDKTAHRPLALSGKGLVGLSARLRGAVPVLLILLILFGAAMQGSNVYTYTIRDMSEDARQVSSLFGQSNQVALIFPRDDTDEGLDRQRQMLADMRAVTAHGQPVVQDILSMVTTGEAAIAYYDAAGAAALLGRDEAQVQRLFALLNIETPIRGDALLEKLSLSLGSISFLLPGGAMDQLRQAQTLLDTADAAFNGPHYSRALLSLDMTFSDPEAHSVIVGIKEILNQYHGQDAALAGMLAAMDDIATSFSGDMRRVSLITIGLVFLIILLSFRSLAVPALLVCVIQGAIWINMCFSNWYDGSIFFMCYLICMALQMGATIDYGILLTSHYRALRLRLDKKEAAVQAVGLSLQTILTSGSALIVAGFSVGIVSSVFYISSIGTMLGRGAIVSVVLVLFLLPALLQALDRWIVPKK